MSHGYAVANALTGLAATAFTWSSAYAVDRGRLNDTIQDRLAASGSGAQASGQTLSIDLGSAQSLAGLALLNHNLATGACTVSVTAGTDGITYGTTAKAASTIVTLAPNQKDTVLQFPAAAFRYWRLTFIHTGTKIVTLGEVLALPSITVLSRTTIYGAGEEERYVANQVESKTGHLRATFVGGPIRTKTLPFKDLNPEEKAELRAMWAATRGGVSNLLWVEFVEPTSAAATADAQECLWGKIAPVFGWKNSDFRLFDDVAFRLVGQGREVGS